MSLTRHQIDFLVMRAQQLIDANVPERNKEPARLIVFMAERVERSFNMTLGAWLTVDQLEATTNLHAASNEPFECKPKLAILPKHDEADEEGGRTTFDHPERDV